MVLLWIGQRLDPMAAYKHIIQASRLGSADGQCLKYSCDLISAKCANTIAFIATDVDDVQVVGCEPSNEGLILAKGLINVVQWLSYRYWSDEASVHLVQQLCGASKDHRREVGRALKRVLLWVETWSDLTTPPSVQLQEPTCGIILFDKKLRHRSISYMLECDANSTCKTAHLTLADVHLCRIIETWMSNFATDKTYISSMIPAIVHYVRSIRAELRRIEIDYCDSLSIFEAHFISDLWVDSADVTSSNTHNFKFTQKEKGAKSSKTVNDTVEMVQKATAPLDMQEIEKQAQELIKLVPWHSAEASEPQTLLASDCTPQESAAPSGHLDFSHCNDMWEKMKLPAGREVRKTQQITSLLREINTVLPIGGVAVEFCAGGGYVGIPLAVLRPDCTVLLTDMNTVSIQYAKARVERLGLTNVKFLRQELAGIEALQQNGHTSASADAAEDSETALLSRFHVGIALHACGTATDAVLRICTRAGASFVVSPCCYGFLQHQAGTRAALEKAASLEENSLHTLGDSFCRICLAEPSQSECECSTCTKPDPNSNLSLTRVCAPYTSYPASQAFLSCGWEDRWFAALCSRADRTFWSHDARAVAHNAQGQLAMCAVDTDRLLAAQEQGYVVYGTFMWPVEASVKNHILVGVKRIV